MNKKKVEKPRAKVAESDSSIPSADSVMDTAMQANAVPAIQE